jgi:hypothetical protein
MYVKIIIFMNQGTTSLRHRNTIHEEQDGENQGKMII